jgi:hypothetical protein
MPGPYYFAWVDATETTFGGEHVRNDEAVFSFRITHTEGDFPQMEVVIRNPGVGLLAPGRKVWAWFSYDRDGDPVTEASSESEPSELGVVPLFFGRLLGYPVDVQGDAITLTFVARPGDYAVQQAAVAETLKVAPYYDPIWFDPKDDKPDNVLEGRSALWHIDRTSHVVTTSDIIVGEDGVLSFDGTNAFYDSLSVQVSQTPVRRVEVIAAVGWDQKAHNNQGLDFGAVIRRQADSSSASLGGGGGIGTYTGPGLQADWPKPGDSFGGGWFVTDAGLDSACAYQAKAYFDDTVTPGRVSRRGGASIVKSVDLEGGFTEVTAQIKDANGPLQPGYNAPYMDWLGRTYANTVTNTFTMKLWVPRWDCSYVLKIGYDVSRSMKETVQIALEADMQSILVEPGDDEVIQLTLESSELVSRIDPGGLMPIRDVRNRTYFASDRGVQSIESLIAIARAHLLARSRAITVAFQTDFDTAVDMELSCRKSAFLEDPRLPGGQAFGKVVGYTLSGDGDSGAFGCEITMACAVGRGNTVGYIPGEPCYVVDGYVNDGYQMRIGEFVVPIPGEVNYGSILGQLPNDDGVDFRRMDVFRLTENCAIANGWLNQEPSLFIGGNDGDPAKVFLLLNEVRTQVTLELQPLDTGPFDTTWDIATSLLMVPKQIDLESA